MILVTGTKRSGTSMWMQILRAAGLPSIGVAFPDDWTASLREANPEGFFESRLRDGIHFLTNPDPDTGAYLHPADVRTHAVKVFVPGLTKTDLAFVERVIACVRDVREYDASVRRLEALEDADAATIHGLPKLRRATPYLEWWRDNYALLVDAMTRRYPIHVVSNAAVAEDAPSVIRRAIAFLGVGDPESAVAAVRPELRRIVRPRADELPGVDATTLASFDLLRDVLVNGPPDDDAWIDRLGETHASLVDAIEADVGAADACREERRRTLEALRGRSEP